MHQHLRRHDVQRHGDHGHQIRPSDIHARPVKPRQKHHVEDAEQQQRQAEKRHVRVDAHRVAAVGIDAHAHDGKRYGQRKLYQLQHGHKQNPPAHHGALRRRQHGGIVHVPVLARVHKAEKHAQRAIENGDVIRIARDQQHCAEEHEQQRCRVQYEAKLLIQNLRCHSFSFPAIQTHPPMSRQSPDTGQGSPLLCRCRGFGRFGSS